MFGLSDESTVALAAVIVSGVVGVTTLLVNHWNGNRERQHRLAERDQDNREWYRRTLFERRLEALQAAHIYLDQAWDVFYSPVGDPGPFPLDETLGWYRKNVLYIHGEMPRRCPLAALLMDFQLHSDGFGDMPGEERWNAANELIERQARDLLRPLHERP